MRSCAVDPFHVQPSGQYPPPQRSLHEGVHAGLRDREPEVGLGAELGPVVIDALEMRRWSRARAPDRHRRRRVAAAPRRASAAAETSGRDCAIAGMGMAMAAAAKPRTLRRSEREVVMLPPLVLEFEPAALDQADSVVTGCGSHKRAR